MAVESQLRCGHDVLIAFSCTENPSCAAKQIPLRDNAQRMVATAAQWADHTFPHLPVRQRVPAWPKRLRDVLHRDPDLQGSALRRFLRAVIRRPGTRMKRRMDLGN